MKVSRSDRAISQPYYTGHIENRYQIATKIEQHQQPNLIYNFDSDICYFTQPLTRCQFMPWAASKENLNINPLVKDNLYLLFLWQSFPFREKNIK